MFTCHSISSLPTGGGGGGGGGGRREQQCLVCMCVQLSGIGEWFIRQQEIFRENSVKYMVLSKLIHLQSEGAEMRFLRLKD